MAVHFLLETSGPADIENILPSLLLRIFKSFWNGLFLILDEELFLHIAAIES